VPTSRATRVTIARERVQLVHHRVDHQGTETVPTDFLIAARSDVAGAVGEPHHSLLLANCFAQSEALMRGRSLADVRDEMAAAGIAAADIERLAPHKVCPGNRPSNTLLYGYLDPETLGMIVALYEHKTFVEGVLWQINSFDQWGVELGKALAASFAADGRGETVGGTRFLHVRLDNRRATAS